MTQPVETKVAAHLADQMTPPRADWIGSQWSDAAARAYLDRKSNKVLHLTRLEVARICVNAFALGASAMALTQIILGVTLK